MDVAVTSMGLAQMNLQSAASMMVMRKALDAASQQGSDLISAMPAVGGGSVEPHLGNSIDIQA